MAQVMTCDITSTPTKVVLATGQTTLQLGEETYTWDTAEPGEQKIKDAEAKYQALLQKALVDSGLAALLDKATITGPEPVSAPPAQRHGGMSKNKMAKLNQERNGRIRAWAADTKNWAAGAPAPGKFPGALIEAYQKANPHDLPVVG